MTCRPVMLDAADVRSALDEAEMLLAQGHRAEATELLDVIAARLFSLERAPDYPAGVTYGRVGQDGERLAHGGVAAEVRAQHSRTRAAAFTLRERHAALVAQASPVPAAVAETTSPPLAEVAPVVPMPLPGRSRRRGSR